MAMCQLAAIILLKGFHFLAFRSIHLMENEFVAENYSRYYSRLGMSVTTQGGSGRQFVTGP